VVPVITNGHVFAGSQYTLDVFGLFPDSERPPDGAPSKLAATSASRQVQLTWTNNATNTTGIKILRSTDGKTFTQVNTAPRDATTFTDKGLTPLTTYFYQVVATNQYGDLASGVAMARTLLPAPVVLVADVLSRSIDLSWTAVADGHYE